MIERIYIEEEVSTHPRTAEILARFPKASKIYCQRYGEVFNPKAQNFRIQKQKPALLLAKKHGHSVLQAPDGYGVGGNSNFYFSHMLNCLYDCRYCFLQGMYRSANYVLFVNYEDFADSMDHRIDNNPAKQTWFFSGYDCDSLALEPISNFLDFFLDYFATRPNAYLELRTKSTQIRKLLECEPLDNVVTAFSFTPDPVSRTLEHKVPSVAKRVDAMRSLAEKGWKVGVRLDPMIFYTDYKTDYQVLIHDLFSDLDLSKLHSVSLGAFRLPRSYFKTIRKLYPDEPLFAQPLELYDGMIGYGQAKEEAMLDFCETELRRYVPKEKLYPCVVTS